MVKENWLSRLALGASFFALAVIGLGAFTRLIEAGLGCPDWPGCYGHFAVPLSQLAQQLAQLKFPDTQLVFYKAWAEMAHRYCVAGLCLLILMLIMTVFGKKVFRTRLNLALVFVLIGLVCYQIILGKWTVTLKLLPLIVSQHLLCGFFILNILWTLYLNNSYVDAGAKLPPATRHLLLTLAVVALVLLFLQIALGAWTSTNYAALSCPDFPFCSNDKTLTWQFGAAFNIFSPPGINYEGGVLPEAVRQTIQMTHRLGALVVTVYLLIFMLVAAPKLLRFPELMQSIYLILALLCIQLSLGIANVMFKLPLATAVSHNIVAVLFSLSVLTFIFKLAKVNTGVTQS